MHSMLDFFLNLKLPKEIITLIISMLPIVEIRGSLPIAVTIFKIPLWKAYLLSVLGNSIIIIPFILFLEKFSNYFMNHKYFSTILNWWFSRLNKNKNKDLMQKYKALGLAIFVAIPLPATGAWSGCVLAYLFGIKKRLAFPSIFLGVIIAGLIVLSITFGLTKI